MLFKRQPHPKIKSRQKRKKNSKKTIIDMTKGIKTLTMKVEDTTMMMDSTLDILIEQDTSTTTSSLSIIHNILTVIGSIYREVLHQQFITIESTDTMMITTGIEYTATESQM